MTTRNRDRRIVVGVDGSPESLAALAWAVEEAERTGGEIDAVLAYDSGLPGSTSARSTRRPSWNSRPRGQRGAAPRARGVGNRGSTSVPVRPLVVEGQPARVLIEIARDADLLVVGSRGRGGFTGVMLGSVSQRCAGHSPCPVVVVPPHTGHDVLERMRDEDVVQLRGRARCAGVDRSPRRAGAARAGTLPDLPGPRAGGRGVRRPRSRTLPVLRVGMAIGAGRLRAAPRSCVRGVELTSCRVRRARRHLGDGDARPGGGGGRRPCGAARRWPDRRA